MSNRETWLNGHYRNGDTVLVGATLCCAGCGRHRGLVALAIREDDVLPEKDPDWPFNEEDCPVCLNLSESARLSSAITKEIASPEDVAKLDWLIIRKAIEIKKAT